MADAAEVHKPIQEGTEGVTSVAAGPQTARRRLMLGAAAVLPSVFTLTSGAQVATGSNTCWARGSRDSNEKPLFTMDHDEWLRKKVYFGQSNHGRLVFCAMDDQATCVDPTNPAKPAAGSIWFDHANRQTVDAASITQISTGPQQAYALVYVDQQGTIATLDPGSRMDLEPIKETCWTSILGGRISPLG